MDYEKRIPSIVNKVTPTARMAWIAEHEALVEAKHGNTAISRYYIDEGIQLRQKDIHEKIITLFERSDAQNAVIEIGLKHGA